MVPPRLLDRNGIRVREDVLYTDAKGREKGKLRKRATKAFDDLGDVLRRVLEPTETIFYIAQAQIVPGALAQFLGGGWHQYSIPGTFLFFTDRRMIALRVRKRMGGWSWNQGIKELRWGDLLEAVPVGFLTRYLTLKFRNGEKQAYSRFGTGDAAKIRFLIQILRASGVGTPTAAGGMVALCPNCLNALTPRDYRCPRCGTRFKDEKTLLWRGLVVPGGASLYVGAKRLGSFRALFEAIFLFSILWSVVIITREPSGSKATAAVLAGIAIECSVLILDKLIAIAVSLPQIRDFIPIASNAEITAK